VKEILKKVNWFGLGALNPGVPTNPVSDLASAVWVGSRRVHYVYENANPTLSPTLPTVDTEDQVIMGNLGGVGFGGVALDGDVLTYSASDPSHGTVVVAPDGTYVYTPDADLAHNGGTDTFTASVSGVRLVRHVFGYAGFLRHVVPKLAPTGSTAADTAVVTINVPLGLVNAAPTVDTLTLDAANGLSGAVSGRLAVTDADGDTLTYPASIATAKGTAVVAADGSFIYTPSAATRHAAAADGASAAELSDTFTIMVSDGHGGTTPAVVTVAISPTNTAPVAGTTTVGEPDISTGAVAGQLAVTDADNDTLSYTVGDGPSNGTVAVNAVTGAFVYTPSEEARQGAGTGAGTGTGTGTGTGLQTITLSDPTAVTLGTYGGWTGGGGTYNYVATFFTAAETETYIFGQTSAPVDTVMEIYNGTFNPGAPGVGRLDVNDDTGTAQHAETGATVTGCGGVIGYCPQVQANLTAGQVITLVVTTYSAGLPLGLPQSFYSNRGGSFSATTPGVTTDSFTVVVNDGHGGTTTVSVSVGIAPAPQPSAV
jgi:VCBS repeat-containing protein